MYVGSHDAQIISVPAKIRRPAEASFEFAILMREIIIDLKKNEAENLSLPNC